MINNIYIIIFMSLYLSSCSKSYYDMEYKGESNFKNLYIVDTIKVLKPVRIHSPKFGGQFIVSKEVLNFYKKNVAFFNRPDVFL